MFQFLKCVSMSNYIGSCAYIPQEQYKVIFLALNEEFKSDVNPQSLTDFTECVKSLTEDIPANQAVIRKQFKVDNLLF